LEKSRHARSKIQGHGGLSKNFFHKNNFKNSRKSHPSTNNKENNLLVGEVDSPKFCGIFLEKL